MPYTTNKLLRGQGRELRSDKVIRAFCWWIAMAAKEILRICVFIVAALLVAALLVAGCSKKQGGPADYPLVEEFDSAAGASRAAGFDVREPDYTAGGDLQTATVVTLSPGKAYVDLDYTNNLEIIESPRAGSYGYEQAVEEYERCIEATPENLRTYEEPTEVEIGGNRGILWMHRGGLVLEEREETGVPSFHVPYIVWWDSQLEYRLWIDEPRLFDEDPAAGVEELEQVADSIYR